LLTTERRRSRARPDSRVRAGRLLSTQGASPCITICARWTLSYSRFSSAKPNRF
jgi:hypothetical protein